MEVSNLWDTKTIVRRIKVNRDRTPLQELDIMESVGGKRIIIVEPEALLSFPSPGKGEEDVEVVFFHLSGHCATAEEVSVQRAVLGLVDDPFAQLAVNEADLVFGYNHDNSMSWKDKDGKSCYLSMVYDPETGDQYVLLGYKPNRHWFGTSFGGWWFSGVRKPSLGR